MKETTIVNHLGDQLDWVNYEDAVRIIQELKIFINDCEIARKKTG